MCQSRSSRKWNEQSKKKGKNTLLYPRRVLHLSNLHEGCLQRVPHGTRFYTNVYAGQWLASSFSRGTAPACGTSMMTSCDYYSKLFGSEVVLVSNRNTEHLFESNTQFRIRKVRCLHSPKKQRLKEKTSNEIHTTKCDMYQAHNNVMYNFARNWFNSFMINSQFRVYSPGSRLGYWQKDSL